MTSDLPPSGLNEITGFTVEGRPAPQSGHPDVELIHHVSSGYFGTMGIPLFRGRDFAGQDNQSAPPVIVINEALARKYWGGQDPIGSRVKIGTGSPFTVVGIVGDVRQEGLDRPPIPELYVSHLQSPTPWMLPVVRTVESPMVLISAIKQEVHTLDPNIPVENLRTMNQVLADKVAPFRYAMIVMAILAGVALVLAAIGIYGVISYSVSQRTREIGVRMALGGRPRDMLKMVLGQGMVLLLSGWSLGLMLALGLTRLIASQLFGVAPTDLPTFVLVSVLLGLIAVSACYFPARRAARVDPIVALRHE